MGVLARSSLRKVYRAVGRLPRSGSPRCGGRKLRGGRRCDPRAGGVQLRSLYECAVSGPQAKGYEVRPIQPGDLMLSRPRPLREGLCRGDPVINLKRGQHRTTQLRLWASDGPRGLRYPESGPEGLRGAEGRSEPLPGQRIPAT